MVVFRTHSRRAARTRAAALPNDRLVVASALTAMVVLLMMLVAGTA